MNSLAELMHPQQQLYVEKITEFAKTLWKEEGDRFEPEILQRLINEEHAEIRSKNKTIFEITNETMERVRSGDKEIIRSKEPYFYRGDEPKAELRRWLNRCKTAITDLRSDLAECRQHSKETADKLEDRSAEVDRLKRELATTQSHRDTYKMKFDNSSAREQNLYGVLGRTFEAYEREGEEWLRLAEETDRASDCQPHQGPVYKKVRALQAEVVGHLSGQEVADMTAERISRIFKLEQLIQQALRDGSRKLRSSLQKDLKQCVDVRKALRAHLEDCKEQLDAEEVKGEEAASKLRAELSSQRRDLEEDRRDRIKTLTTSHAKEKEELEKSIAEKSAEITELESRDVGGDAYLAEVKSDLQSKVYVANQSEARARGKVSGLEERLRDKSKEVTKHESENKRLESDVERLRKFESSATLCEERLKVANQQLEECRKKRDALSDNLNDETIRANDLQRSLDMVQGRLDALNASSDEAKRLAAEIETVQSEHTKELQRCHHEKHQLELEKVGLDHKKSNLETERDSLKKDIDTLTTQRDEARTQIARLQAALGDSQAAGQQAKDDC